MISAICQPTPWSNMILIPAMTTLSVSCLLRLISKILRCEWNPSYPSCNNHNIIEPQRFIINCSRVHSEFVSQHGKSKGAKDNHTENQPLLCKLHRECNNPIAYQGDWVCQPPCRWRRRMIQMTPFRTLMNNDTRRDAFKIQEEGKAL